MADIPAFFHDDYEKITDDLAWLGFSQSSKCSYILRFNVILANMTKDGRRIPFHTEYRYETRKYTNVFAGNTIRRHITYYMSIESAKADEFGNKDFLMIRPCDILFLREQFKQVYSWFFDEKHSLFTYKDNKLVVQGRIDLTIAGFAQNKYIIVSPIVMDIRGELQPGIRIVLNNGSEFEMSMDNFAEFYYVITSIDMYNCASTLMAYFGRPEFGTNLWQSGDQNKLYENQEPVDIDALEGHKKRQFGKSFFD